MAGACQAKSISCPNCGGPVELRGFAHTLSVGLPAVPQRPRCVHARSSNPPEVPGEDARVKPTIPLGTRGKIGGTQYEVIGFQGARSPSETTRITGTNTCSSIPTRASAISPSINGHWNFVHVWSRAARANAGGAAESRCAMAVRLIWPSTP